MGEARREQEIPGLAPVDEGTAPARPLSAAETAAFVEAVLRQAAAPPTGTVRRRHRKTLSWTAGVVALTVATAAAALIATRARRRPEPSAYRSDEQVTRPAAPPAAVRQTPASQPVQAEPPVSLRESPPRAPRVRRMATAAVEPGADALLRSANDLRAQHRWVDATARYEEVIARFPSTHAAYVALVAAADLRLEHLTDPAGAARLYRRARALRPGGDLREEASYGLARAYRQLGQPAAEQETLRALLDAFPDSVLRDTVERRLRDLPSAATRSGATPPPSEP